MRWYFALLGFFATALCADTIDNYVNISNHITTMEMKADRDSQTWARSARNVFAITNESIAETLLETNRIAANAGHPLFCMPQKLTLDASTIRNLLDKALKANPELQSSKDRPTISEIATLAVIEAFPCQKTARYNALKGFDNTSTMQHKEG